MGTGKTAGKVVAALPAPEKMVVESVAGNGCSGGGGCGGGGSGSIRFG